MARARNIKPGFFESEQLGRCPLGARLLFVALWQVADREGRLEDRMMRLRAYAFPYDSISMIEVDSWMDALEAESLVERYEVGGCRYIRIPKFLKHQNPHVKEKESMIPDKPSASPVQAPDFPNSKSEKTPDSHGAFVDSSSKEILLNPESGILNPFSLTSGAIAHAPAEKLKREKKSFVPPTIEEVRAYCQQENLIVNPVTFWHHHDDNGWTRGKTMKPIQKWRSVIRIWEENERKSQSIAKQNQPYSEPSTLFVPKPRPAEDDGPDDEPWDLDSMFRAGAPQ